MRDDWEDALIAGEEEETRRRWISKSHVIWERWISKLAEAASTKSPESRVKRQASSQAAMEKVECCGR